MSFELRPSRRSRDDRGTRGRRDGSLPCPCGCRRCRPGGRASCGANPVNVGTSLRTTSPGSGAPRTPDRSRPAAPFVSTKRSAAGNRTPGRARRSGRFLRERLVTAATAVDERRVVGRVDGAARGLEEGVPRLGRSVGDATGGPRSARPSTRGLPPPIPQSVALPGRRGPDVRLCIPQGRARARAPRAHRPFGAARSLPAGAALETCHGVESRAPGDAGWVRLRRLR